MFGCLMVLMGMAAPRVAIALIFLFKQSWLADAYATVIWPLLGFLAMPYTTLAVMVARLNAGGEVAGGWIALVAFAVIVDLGHWFGSGKRYRLRVVRDKH